MARTIAAIYSAIIAEKQNQTSLSALVPEMDDAQTLLNDLTSPSKVAVWRLWCYIIAVAIWMHETLWDFFRAEVEAIIAASIPGTVPWYQEQCLLFQYGDDLIWKDGKFQYEVIDATKCIIKRAAVTEVAGQVRIKVAKLSSGVPSVLTSEELAAFQSYIDHIRYAGTNVAILNYPADFLKLSYKIIYDPKVLNASGMNLTDSTYPVEDAINAYIAGIIWDGSFNITKSIDAIQAVDGVEDVILLTANGKAANAVSYTQITPADNNNYRSVAGCMVIDPLFPLSDTLIYVANV